MTATLLLAAAGSGLTAVVTYILVRRRESGGVSASKADELWRVLSERLAATERTLAQEREERDEERARDQKLRHDLRNKLMIARLEAAELRKKLNGHS